MLIILLIIGAFCGGYLFACFMQGAFGKATPYQDMDDYYNNVSEH